ncbi:MAG: zinc-dependent metalloprotease [Saprospiraceae bacterium]|nr:zinc-dependent metalloprotease [Saprospiraceae bacterium]
MAVACEGWPLHDIRCDDYPDTYGPHYVKAYLWFVVPPNAPNAFEDPLDERTATIWANLFNAFAPHNIHIVPGFGDCSPSATYEAINEDLAPNNANVFYLRSIGHKNDDGIDMYVFRDDIAVGGGWAFCVPSSFFYLFGKEPNTSDNVSATQIVSHEMGHCLGLLHTFEEGPGTSCRDLDGSDCKFRGDLVCDTPPDDRSYPSNPDCDPQLLSSELDFNIMSGFSPWRCVSRFTNGQGARMRRYLSEPVGVVDDAKIQDIVVTGQVTWDTPMSPGANVIVEPEAVLTINAPVTMQENARIYVRRGDGQGTVSGGQLRVFSTITAVCDKLWGGVVVEGYANRPQSTVYQGRAYVGVGGVLEHARLAIYVNGLNPVTGFPVLSGGGGMVGAQGAVFRNNEVDVEFGPYFASLNRAYFTASIFDVPCRFVTDDGYRGGRAPTHLFLKGVFGVRVADCIFTDDRTDSYSLPKTRGVGIYSEDAGFLTYQPRPNRFFGLFHGIHVLQTSPTAGIAIRGGIFEACFDGVHATDNAILAIDDNTFTLRRPDFFTGPASQLFRAIYVEGGTATISLDGNVFVGADTVLLFGTEVLSIGGGNKVFSGNTYHELYVGNRAYGLNGVASAGGLIFSGLMYECSSFTRSSEHDNLVALGATIRLEQGRKIDGEPISAGNRYLDLVGQQFTNNGAPIFYHHIENTTQALIDGYFTPTTITRVQSLPNAACDVAECPPPCDTETELSETKTQFFQQKQTWTTKTAAYPSITDPNQRQTEADVINRLRLSLDQTGARILLHHALDTTDLRTDSVLVWLGHLETYDADLQLARHHFFSGDYSTADSLLQLIPSQYGLSGDWLAEFNDVRDVLDALRPRLEAGVSLSALPETLVDSILYWGADCSAAGALARNILCRNGLRKEADCEEIGQKASGTTQSNAIQASGQTLKIYPNPASAEVSIELPLNVSCTNIAIVSLADGRICLDFAAATGSNTVKINIAGFSGGVYAVLARMVDGSTLRAKLLISN